MDPEMVRAFLSLSARAEETRTPLAGPPGEGSWGRDLAQTSFEMAQAALVQVREQGEAPAQG
jgi:hypothetical protein